MTLSIVIVNYNVKHYLEQCLRSVFSSNFNNSYNQLDVWVVDNNSTDGSVQMLREKFPQVHLIANSDNPGFATANNQALRQILDNKTSTQHSSDSTHPQIILLLNPDTILQKDTLSCCVEFFGNHTDCGALSVKMINGEGVFLKESKRGFPSPSTSFFKISGLIKIFPHSRKVGAYYMGHLDDNTINEVDVLPGAFLMISRQALEKTGLLDESYFMYGEDIDFSWRVKLAGYKNYYLPTTRILHYKGESTRKSSMNYVYTFYNAMAIFARKYFSKKGAKTYNIIIQLAIWLRASFDFLKRIVTHLALPALDFAVSFAGFIAIKHLWATFWAENVNYYPAFYIQIVLPLYVLILLLASWLAGGYDKPVRLDRIAKGMSVGALSLLVFYSLLNEHLRFSRAIVLIGSLWSILATLGIRGILNILHIEGFYNNNRHHRRYIVVGSQQEATRLSSLFDSLGIEPKSLYLASSTDNTALTTRKPKADEIIFCSHDIPIKQILDTTERLSGCGADFRILPDQMDILIGSNYTNSPEDLYTPDFGNIASITNRRSKRLLDILSSALLILLSPLLFWPQKHKHRYFNDCFSVLFGQRTWVGYSTQQLSDTQHPTANEPLPAIRHGVFRTRDRMPRVKKPDCQRLDQLYASDYHVTTDLTIILINILKI